MKRETVDLDRMVHIDSKGIERPLAIGERRGTAIYIERKFLDHPVIKWLRAWHFPALGWRVCVFGGDDGPWPWDWYIDIARITETTTDSYGPCRLEVLDLYADVAVHEGERYVVMDLDELADSLEAGELSPSEVAWALRRTEQLTRLLEENGLSMNKVLDLALRGEVKAADGVNEGFVTASSGPRGGRRVRQKSKRSRHGVTKGPAV